MTRDWDILDSAKRDPLKGAPSFSLRNRVYRLSWVIAWAILARWTPTAMFGWRRLITKLFGAEIHATAAIYPSARIWSPRNLKLEEYSTIGPRAIIYSMANVHLREFALVSQGAHICTGTHNIQDRKFQLEARPIVIGRRAWVAAEAFVGPGVTVGDGAVLGARGCTFRDLEDWKVYIGNPARFVKERIMIGDEYD